MSRSTLRVIALGMAVITLAIQAWRMGLASGRNSSNVVVATPRQDIAALTTRFHEGNADGAPPLISITNDWREVAALLSNYQAAAYELGRNFLLTNPNASAVEIWIPMPPDENPQWDPIMSYELRRSETGISWGYSVGLTYDGPRGWDRSHAYDTGPAE